MSKLAAIVLAAGKGKRIGAKKINKVVLPLVDRPMIVYTVDLLDSLRIAPIVAVVGFAKKSVMEVLKGRVIFAHQRKRLGTAHAVLCALRYLSLARGSDVNNGSAEVTYENFLVRNAKIGSSSNLFKNPASAHNENFVGSPRLINRVKDVLVLNGDDSAFYRKETIENLIKVHQRIRSSVTFLTVEVDNPSGLGRIARDDKGRLVGIVEDKDTKNTKEELGKIREVNPACYVFSVDFLRKFLKKIKKSKITGEYYLTSLIDIAIKNNEKIEAVNAGKLYWRGVNTLNELKEAERKFLFRHFG